MDANTVKLVQDSWQQVLPIANQAGTLFYKNLFEAAPQLRPLFKGDLEQQAIKLMQMINVTVGKLNEPDVLLPALQQLGKRHASYGVEPTHYAPVGAALLKTLEQGLGDKFTPDTRQAWTQVYGGMTQVMTTA
jgi:hemoglobin-like flavoprotein